MSLAKPVIASHAARVRALYRQVLRAQRTWPNADERPYIASQVALFRKNQHEASAVRADELLHDGEQRFGIAMHYGVAFPKAHYKIDLAREALGRKHLEKDAAEATTGFD
eukprot:TRINITY_DN4577_c0_g1_i2.p1 TRINITY_DN4577_c0_g1~~TRINITY_DN4577_c0_g1_i2.p1  ORF type:complete len:124 (-),score=39.75 TRINITY_DN4577_c0_g1_i2:23-352(-)